MCLPDKNTCRTSLKAKRRSFWQTQNASVFDLLGPPFLNFLKHTLTILPPSVIAGYWPLKEEADCIPLLTMLSQAGYIIALPYIQSFQDPLFFRKWSLNDALEPFSNTKLLQPLSDKPEVQPTLLLLPLLGFDKFGNRLGYGQGFYDRTLQNLRKNKNRPIIAIGFGFSIQEVENVPHTPEDEKLDWIVTEKEIRSFQKIERDK